MRYVTIPPDVPVMTLDGLQPLREPSDVEGETRPIVLTMERVLDLWVANDEHCRTSLKSVKHAIALMETLGKAKPGDVVAIDEGAWELAKKVLETPTRPHQVFHLFRNAMTFVEALIGAPDKKPVIPSAPAAPAAEVPGDRPELVTVLYGAEAAT